MQTKGKKMKFKKVLPYKLRRVLPILGFAGATLAGCSKDDEPAIQQHDTVYNWGRFDISQVWPTDNINASADSVEVRRVILQLNDSQWGSDKDGKYGLDDRWILDEYVTPIWNNIKESNRHKVMFRGDAWNVSKPITPEDWRAFDSLENVYGIYHKYSEIIKVGNVQHQH